MKSVSHLPHHTGHLAAARLVTSCSWLLVTEEAEAAQEPVTVSRQELRWPVVSVVRGCSYYCH